MSVGMPNTAIRTPGNTIWAAPITATDGQDSCAMAASKRTMMNSMGDMGRPAASRPAGRGRASSGVDIANPIFGLGILMLVTVFPYFYSTSYIEVRKYWSLEAHLAF